MEKTEQQQKTEQQLKTIYIFMERERVLSINHGNPKHLKYM